MMLLVAMAIDRYVTICKPLHYLTIMSPRVLVQLLLSSCIVGFVHSSSQMAFMLNLPFCGPTVVDSFFCDLPLVIKLACKFDNKLTGLITNLPATTAGLTVASCPWSAFSSCLSPMGSSYTQSGTVLPWFGQGLLHSVSTHHSCDSLLCPMCLYVCMALSLCVLYNFHTSLKSYYLYIKESRSKSSHEEVKDSTYKCETHFVDDVSEEIISCVDILRNEL
ncbi:unnamed protein product [Gulo gulo]|uniref:G-protein coupled receptors family 1 profile domain-containing protein n=1 Tax=Gulo gulo TaxID=48420 RepID=A0A9X9PYQ3_GULGU|nr:unnamed protein product [Gulo gulo]